MQVVPSGGQICNKCKWCHLVVKFGTNASCAIWWPNLELMHVEPPLAGEITQVLDAIPWVRCASGNVSCIIGHFQMDFKDVHDVCPLNSDVLWTPAILSKSILDSTKFQSRFLQISFYSFPLPGGWEDDEHKRERRAVSTKDLTRGWIVLLPLFITNWINWIKMLWHLFSSCTACDPLKPN